MKILYQGMDESDIIIHMVQKILITKASGVKEPFAEEKLRRSLERAKVSSGVIEKIVVHVKGELFPGASTKEIYRHAFSLLKKFERKAAARYSLKKAITELGPEGRPFESLVGALLKLQGYSVEIGKVVQGRCIKHEVDVVATKGSKHFMVECKFHNQQGLRSDVKVALYVQARFEDVRKAWEQEPGITHEFHQAWLVTNTKFTSDAIQYAACMGLNAVSWDYPAGNSLRELIEKTGLHPLTCLTTLTRSHKKVFLDKGAILCKDVVENKNLLKSMGFSESKIEQIKEEVRKLCVVSI